MPPFKLNPPPASLHPGSSILVYLRDSGHETQELSVLQQHRILDEWAAQHHLVISRYFIDEARRGATSAGREQLQLLMHALRHQAPESAVIVWSYNRFSRGLDEPALYRAEIRTLGYTFHSLTDDVPEGPIGRIVEAVIDYKNYQYLVDLSIDIQRGQRDLVRNHGCIPGTPPRGFKRIPVKIGQHRDGTPHNAHRWEPDPETAPLVLRAFEMRAAGASISAIADATRLYSSRSCFTTFWTNKLYIGILQFGDMEIKEYCHPIVPLSVWDAVQTLQNQFRERKNLADQNHPRRISSIYLLSGLLHCSQCDAPVNGNTSTCRGKRATDTYMCANVRKHLCTSRRIPRQLLENCVMDAIKNFILNPDIVLARQQNDIEGEKKYIADLELQKIALRTKLTSTRRALKRLTEAIKQRRNSKTLLNELDELEAEETTLVAQIAQLEYQPILKLDRTDIETQSLAIEKLLEEGTIEEKHAVIHGLIHKITVENAQKHILVKITFYSPITINPDSNDVSIIRFPPGAPVINNQSEILLK